MTGTWAWLAWATCTVRLLFLLLAAAGQQLVPHHEMTALSSLYTSTNGDSWQWLEEESAGSIWNFTVNSDGEFVHNPCSSGSDSRPNMTWQGVFCSHSPFSCSVQTCHITGIDLSSYHLSGSIPGSIGNMSFLYDLILDRNQLIGSIPPDIGNLSSLLHLSLYSNLLTGSIPFEIGQLQALTFLDFDTNPLSGTLPHTMGNLTSLKTLYIIDTGITGSIPSTVGNLQNIQILYLNRNQLTGSLPFEIGQLSALWVFYAQLNQLTGSLPGGLADLTSLEILSFHDNLLTGSIPSKMTNLTSLRLFYLHNNMISGPIPEGVEQLKNLQRLYVYGNQLTGTIPNELGLLAQLEQLFLSSNQLTGSIPSSIGQLTLLNQLYLHSNILNGTIPVEIGQLTRLAVLYFSTNQLEGTIPNSIGYLSNLVYLFFHRNLFSGPIPDSIGQLSSVREVHLSTNRLNGSIPSTLWQLPAVTVLYIHENRLIGSIPSMVGQLTTLMVLSLYGNALTGTIPAEVGKLNALELCFLSLNQLTGTIPIEVGNLTALQFFSLHSNALTGSIPTNVGLLSILELFHFHRNQLMGSIPVELGHLSFLEQLFLFENQLTGSIPNVIGNLTSLNVLYFNDNFLTGTIPSELGQLRLLELLQLYSNMLTGTIPSSIGLLEKNRDLWLHDNMLEGSLPRELSWQKSLRNLFLQDNILTGNLNGVFNCSTQLELNTIDLSNNQFVGSLPEELMLLPQLVVLSLSGARRIVLHQFNLMTFLQLTLLDVLYMCLVNCFENELPQNLCDAEQVEVLSLNGLRASTGCTSRIVVPLSGVALFNTIGGSVPPCVWALRNLSVLHLTGNGLSGELVQFLPSHSQISDLSLSHNQIGGTIPFDYLGITKLDLSFNEIGGELSDSGVQRTADSVVILEVNRLSGQLPVSELDQVSNGKVSVLNGNLFSCNTIPDNDEYSRDYVCGSRNLNYSLLVFTTAFGIALFTSMYVSWGYWSKGKGESFCSKSVIFSMSELLWSYVTYIRYLDTYGLNDMYVISVRRIKVMSNTFEEIMRYALELLAVVLLGSLVLYVVKALDSSGEYSTHRHTYAWFFTLAFMRGVVPAGILLLLWAGAVGVCFYRCVAGHTLRDDTNGMYKDEIGRKEPGCGSAPISDDDVASFRSRIVTGGSVEVLNALITVIVNAIYIYSTQQALGASIHFGFQLSLSVFRLLYSAIAFPVLSRSIRSPVQNVRFRFRLLTLNNLLIPCIVTALTSDACFQGLLLPPDSVSTPYSYRACEQYTTIVASGQTICSQYAHVEVESASLIPPFSYNNQCGSVLLTSYIPVFLLGYALQLILAMVALFPLVYSPYESFPFFARNMFHGLIWPDYWLQGGDHIVHNKIVVNYKFDTLLLSRSIFCNDVLNNWLLMLTFGLCSPFLAVAIVCTVILKMSLLMLLIGRFSKRALCDGTETKSSISLNKPLDTANASTSVITTDVSNFSESDGDSATCFALGALASAHIPLQSVLMGSFWRLAWYSAIFVALLGWDMAADEVGVLEALWVPLLPPCCVIVFHYLSYYWQISAVESSAVKSSAVKNVTIHPRESTGVPHRPSDEVENPLHFHDRL